METVFAFLLAMCVVIIVMSLLIAASSDDCENVLWMIPVFLLISGGLIFGYYTGINSVKK
jgi:hypothetical protein